MYRQLYDKLRTAILEGRLRAGAKLPSTRSLAEELANGNVGQVVAHARVRIAVQLAVHLQRPAVQRFRKAPRSGPGYRSATAR